MPQKSVLLSLLVASSTVVGAEAQSVSFGPEQLVSPENFTVVYGTVPSLAVASDDSFLGAWRVGSRVKFRGFTPEDEPTGAAQTVAGGDDSFPDVELAALSPGRYVAVWADGLLRARFLDGAGAPAGGVIDLAQLARNASVAALPTGGFVAAWTDETLGGYSKSRIAAQRFDAQGVALGPPTLVTESGQTPSVAALPHGGFAVAWYRPPNGGNPYVGAAIEAQIVGPDGVLLGDRLVLASDGEDWVLRVRISADAAGRAVVAWTEFATQGAGEYRIVAQRLSADGQRIDGRILVREIAASGRAILLSDVASRPDGSFLALWREANLGMAPPSGPYTLPVQADVRMRAFDGGGAPLTESLLVHDEVYGEQHEGRAEPTSDGWLVSWRLRLESTSGIYARRVRLDCGAGGELCLARGRFRVTARWTTRDGVSGQARPLYLQSDSGTFWFFSPSNVELVVKVLDGRTLNDKFWVFYGSLTDVEFDLEVRDAQTGAVRTYHNPAGTMASVADTDALPGSVDAESWAAGTAAAVASPTDGSCGPAACLRGGRYRVTVDWRSPATGQSGHGVAAPLTGETGTFWFFNERNVELIVKVLDGRAINGHDWVFYGSLTDVEFDLKVTDTQTGAQRIYHNPAGTLASRADTEAFSP